MSYMDTIISTLKKGVEFAKELGVVEAGEVTGPVATVIAATKVVDAVSSVVSNVQARIAESQLVATSNDQAQIAALAGELSKLNDDLAARIDAS